MPSPTLRDAAMRTAILEFDCGRCDRRGRYRCATLIERHGADTELWRVIDAVAADCLRRRETQVYELCGARCPTLRRLW